MYYYTLYMFAIIYWLLTNVSVSKMVQLETQNSLESGLVAVADGQQLDFFSCCWKCTSALAEQVVKLLWEENPERELPF